VRRGPVLVIVRSADSSKSVAIGDDTLHLALFALEAVAVEQYSSTEQQNTAKRILQVRLVCWWSSSSSFSGPVTGLELPSKLHACVWA
jgi:hypothetical protein